MRKTCRDEYFRDGLQGDTGEIIIAGETFHPVDILESMADTTCRVARADADQRYADEVIEAVLSQYPAPIALAYNAFLHGTIQPLARLGHMRDTWEAAVSVCCALVYSECAARDWKLNEVLMRDGPSNIPRPLKSRDLRSDSISVRLGCLEGVLIHAKVNSAPIQSAQLIPIEVVGEMRRLNDIRNGFSHEQTKSDSQAIKIIDECEQDLLDVLADLSSLSEVEMYRVHEISKSAVNTLKVERLNGSIIARRIKDISVDPIVIAECGALALTGDLDPVFIKCREDLFVGSPYLHCADDESGHQTRVLMLKRVQQEQGLVKYEVSGQSLPLEFSISRIQKDLDRMGALLAVGDGVDDA